MISAQPLLQFQWNTNYKIIEKKLLFKDHTHTHTHTHKKKTKPVKIRNHTCFFGSVNIYWVGVGASRSLGVEPEDTWARTAAPHSRVTDLMGWRWACLGTRVHGARTRELGPLARGPHSGRGEARV